MVALGYLGIPAGLFMVTGVTCFFSFVLLFWNQIFTCRLLNARFPGEIGL